MRSYVGILFILLLFHTFPSTIYLISTEIKMAAAFLCRLFFLAKLVFALDTGENYFETYLYIHIVYYLYYSDQFLCILSLFQ